MIAKLIDGLFGCWHSRYSFPITVRARSHAGPAAALTGTYVVCLDCGKEMPYDWSEMRIIHAPSKKHDRVAALATKHAA